MCGIAGVARQSAAAITVEMLGRMAAAMRHRGPDGYGFFVGQRFGLTHVRLSVIDPDGGAQPMQSDDGRLTVSYSGEIFNHIELRRELEGAGHRFHTRCDTEVLIHGYEEWGAAMIGRLNGQFAFALCDRAADSVLLVRDRFGVRPLFFAHVGRDLLFASEVKAIFATGEVSAVMNPNGLDEIFSFWAVRPPRTPFTGIESLEPGTYAEWIDGTFTVHRYYELDYPEMAEEPRDAVDQLDEIMASSVGMRMRADVPVGVYVSGGLDSSITSRLAAAASGHRLRSFSITFDDPRYDESEFQRAAAELLGSIHEATAVGGTAIADSFSDVLWHTETPLLRTAPVPVYLLAKLTREAGIKVVLTGEGADELFLGYDLFKEVSIRRFCLRNPQSPSRARLFDRLYPDLLGEERGGEFWRRFFLDAGSVTDPLFSHLPRFQLTARIKKFYSAPFRDALAGTDALEELRMSLPARFFGWSPLNKAAFLEMTTLLSPYLLSSQGDRVVMAHGVEARFPFLDHRLFEFAASLPTGSRLRGLREKELLRRWAARILPPSLATRRKRSYRAPDAASFFGKGMPGWVRDQLTPDAVRRCGVFSPTAVAGLMRRCTAGRVTGVGENQALVGVLSTQLWFSRFIEHAPSAMSLPARDATVVLGEGVPAQV